MSDSDKSIASNRSGASSPERSSDKDSLESTKPLDLGILPYLMILPYEKTPKEKEKQATAEQRLRDSNANLTDDVRLAQIFIAFTKKEQRARMDLKDYSRLKGFPMDLEDSKAKAGFPKPTESKKRERSPGPSGGSPMRKAKKAAPKDDKSCAFETPEHQEVVKELTRFQGGLNVIVVKMSWLEETLDNQKIQPLSDHQLIEGNRNPLNQWPDQTVYQSVPSKSLKPNRPITPPNTVPEASGPKTANPDTSEPSSPEYGANNPSFRKSYSPEPTSRIESSGDSEDDVSPKTPDWVKRGLIYSCQRPTTTKSKNEEFLRQLRLIRLSREIRATKRNPSRPGHSTAGNRDTNDFGADAYANMVASIAAYPYRLTNKKEISKLPRCSGKAEFLFEQFQRDGYLHEARDFEQSKELQIRNLFWNIHGVGAATALTYFDDGCSTLADVREREFCSMTDAQKIGLQFYDDFQKKIPRKESEQIASVILEHINSLCGDDKAKHMIVGGYRRGKAESGDVDVIVSHPEPDKTRNLIHDLVAALTKSGWVTHVLGINDSHSRHNEQAIPTSIRQSHKGFDTLDKALLVWQDPSWPTRNEDLARDSKAKNPAVHRRVDIIVSPWKTVGCAVAGWTAGKTFQKDIRKYARAVKDWKFDSTGVEDLKTKKVLDLELYEDEKTRAKTFVEAEKRVFAALGLVYLEPHQRCTD